MDFGYLINLFLDWFERILYSANDIAEFFVQPINILGVNLSPLLLLTASGLVAYISIAVVKWIAS